AQKPAVALFSLAGSRNRPTRSLASSTASAGRARIPRSILEQTPRTEVRAGRRRDPRPAPPTSTSSPNQLCASRRDPALPSLGKSRSDRSAALTQLQKKNWPSITVRRRLPAPPAPAIVRDGSDQRPSHAP